MVFEMCKGCWMLMNGFSKALLETCQNLSHMDQLRGSAVTTVTTSCPSDPRHRYWMFWSAGHTPRWLVATVVLMTSEDKDDQNLHYIRDWMTSRPPLVWTAWQRGQDTLCVRYLMSAWIDCLLFPSLDRWGRPIILIQHPLLSRVSLTPKPCKALPTRL